LAGGLVAWRDVLQDIRMVAKMVDYWALHEAIKKVVKKVAVMVEKWVLYLVEKLDNL